MNKAVQFFKRTTPLSLRLFLRSFRRHFLYIVQSLLSLNFDKKVYCPVNNKKYINFIKSGVLLLSPDLGARSRHRFIWHYLTHHTQIFNPGVKLLHISPEYCFYHLLSKRRDIVYHPVDKFEEGYDYFPDVKYFDLLSDNFAETGYDYLICNHVLEHITEDRKAIGNFYKLLSTNGVAFVTIPVLLGNKPTYEDPSITSATERKKHYGQWDHVRYYGLDVVEKFKEAGFAVTTINSYEYFTEAERKLYGVPEEQHLFVLTK